MLVLVLICACVNRALPLDTLEEMYQFSERKLILFRYKTRQLEAEMLTINQVESKCLYAALTSSYMTGNQDIFTAVKNGNSPLLILVICCFIASKKLARLHGKITKYFIIFGSIFSENSALITSKLAGAGQYSGRTFAS